MKSLIALCLVLLWNSSLASPTRAKSDSSTLRLVNVVFRHGDRNPDTLWDSNPFKDEKFYPEGFGQLTNAGKRTEYNLGLLLRKRFDKFLGDTWNINYVDARSTETNRTKMSLQLVLAGLWPPKKENKWNPPLNWQPIPYNYIPISKDAELAPFVCKTYPTKLLAALSEPELATYVEERYGETLRILGEETGDSSFYGGFGTYFGLLVQEQLGFPLEKWTKQVYPEPIHSLAVDYYYVTTNTTELRQLMSGSLLKKILKDTRSLIEGTLTPSTRKLFLYSGHELNVASLVRSLDVYKLVDIPAYGSHVIIEVHEINGVYGLKIFYGDYTTPEPHGPLVVPGCKEFCPFDEFTALVEEIIPESDEICFGS